MLKFLVSLSLIVAIAFAADEIDDFDDDGTQTREKRAILQTLQTVSYATLMKQLKDAQPCCSEPSLLPNTMHAKCAHIYNSQQKLKITTRYTGGSRNFGFFNMLQSFSNFDTRDSNKPKVIERNYDEYASHACYADCIYQNLDLVDVSNATHTAPLKMDNIAEYYQNATDANPEWESIISNATTFCEKNAFTKPRAVRGKSGRLCSTYPLKFSTCMRKYLFENCLAENTTSTTTCNSTLSSLRSSQFGFTVQAPKEKQSLDTIAVVIRG